MTEHIKDHWAQNEDLREQFVLGNVPASERVTLEAHMRECGECRRLVEDERSLAQGIRAAGRASLRAELSARLRSQGSSLAHDTWRWVAAAATIVAAIGIWRLMTPGQPGVLVPPEVPRIVEQPPIEPTPTDSVRGSDHLVRDERELAGEPFAQTDIALEEESRREVQPSALEAAGAGAREDAVKLEVSDANPHIQAEAWTTGALLTAPSTSGPSMARQEQIMNALKSETKEKDDVRTAKRVDAATGTAYNVQVRQSSARFLPPAQSVGKSLGGSSFPVRLTQVGDSLVIDLYLDPLFSEDGLRTARTLMPKTDSIVVEIENQKIGIQLPPGFIAR